MVGGDVPNGPGTPHSHFLIWFFMCLSKAGVVLVILVWTRPRLARSHYLDDSRSHSHLKFTSPSFNILDSALKVSKSEAERKIKKSTKV